jgi:flagellar hook-associated protein 1 FlgK
MFGNSISILYTALTTDQKALEIRNRNIANADNPDYVRERPVLENLPATGGVDVVDVQRLGDEILFSQLLTSNSKLKGFEEQKKLYETIQTYFDETNGNNLQGAIDKFFQALHDFLREPTNEAAKYNLLSKGDFLVRSFKERYNHLGELQKNIVEKISTVLGKINRIAKQLGELNKEITLMYAKSYSQSKDYKHLLDKRDKLLRELSEYVNVKFKTDKFGRVEVALYEGDSTSSGFIKLVDYNGRYKELEFDSVNKKFVDNEGIAWNFDFFKSGILGAYVNTYNFAKNLKTQLDSLASTLADNVTLNNGDTKVFNGSDVASLALNITKIDLDNYDQTNTDTDADNADAAWKTVSDQYKDFSSYFSSEITDITAKYEVERDLNEDLKTKYLQSVGVNLDEELAEIMKLQQHYQAVSKMLATSTKLLDYLLNSIR